MIEYNHKKEHTFGGCIMEDGGAKRVANLRGLARYIATRKGKVYDRGQSKVVALAAVSEWDKRATSEAFSGPLKSGIIIFK